MIRNLFGAVRARRFGRNTAGGVAVEIALVMPVFLLMTYGFMELGRALFIQNNLAHAVYEAQRYAIVHGASSSTPANTASVRQLILDTAGVLDGDLLDVSVTYVPDNEPGSVVTISAVYAFDYMTGLLPLDAFDMTSTTSATIAY